MDIFEKVIVLKNQTKILKLFVQNTDKCTSKKGCISIFFKLFTFNSESFMYEVRLIVTGAM